MVLNLIQRTVLRELVKVFLLTLVALTGLFLIAGIIQEAAQRGLSPGQILAAIPLLIPNTLPYTIPATTLFATCVVYGRLAADNEVTAIKAAGVHPLSLMRPALMLGLAASGATMYLYYETIPRTQQMLRQRFLSDAEEVLYNILKKERRLVFPNFPFAVFVNEIQGRRLMDVTFKRRVKLPDGNFLGYDLIARAREAKLRVDQAANQVHVDMDRCSVFEADKNVVGNLMHRSFPIPLPEILVGQDNRPKPMALTMPDLLAERQKQYAIADNFRQMQSDARRELETTSPGVARAAELKKHAGNLDYAIADQAKIDRALIVEYNARPAIAVGCLCFVLIGTPVGIWASRADYLSSFVSCFLPVLFVYYPLLLCGTNLAREGKGPMLPCLWAANGVLALAGVVLLTRLARR